MDLIERILARNDLTTLFHREASEPVGGSHLSGREGPRLASDAVDLKWFTIKHSPFGPNPLPKKILEDLEMDRGVFVNPIDVNTLFIQFVSGKPSQLIDDSVEALLHEIF